MTQRISKKSSKKPLKNTAKKTKEKNGSMTKKNKKTDEPPVFLKTQWPEPEIIDINPEEFKKTGTRVIYCSRGELKVEGYRIGLHLLAGHIAAAIGSKFPVFAGGLVNKEWVQSEIKRRSKGIPLKFKHVVIEHILEEAVEILHSSLPRLRKPDGKFARWYLMPSLPYDGQYGEKILQRLQERRDDIRQYKEGGEKIEIWQENRPSIFHGVVLPKHGRITSKYMSAPIEPDINDIEEQTSKDYPNLWVHGTSATALYKPSGDREVPYITLPALHKIEADKKRRAENQIGITVVEHIPPKESILPTGDTLIHFWSFRDIIAQERDFITGIKEGASPLHKRIVELIKLEGARHPGRLADELGIERDKLDKEIKFLVEPKRSPRKTWPGLHYDELSQRYDFHSNWIQETLRYPIQQVHYSSTDDKDGWHDDSFLFFGCLHAGYTTTDYEFVVKNFPKIITKYNIKVVAGVGDFVAGLAYSMMHRGETLQMNYTDQEEFAGEIIGTIFFKAFTENFERALKKFGDKILSQDELKNIVIESLLLFLIKKGNHDSWTLRDGTTPLEKMYDTLILLLANNIERYLAEKRLPSIPVMDIVKNKIVMLPEHKPVYTLDSGLSVGLIHPYMARADTTSLRLEKAIRMFTKKWGCQVIGVANFHVAAVAHKWKPRTGQCVGVQTGTEVIMTPFEQNQMKDIDFGPIFLRVLSRNKRIVKTTVAAFNRTILEEPIPKWTDATVLKKKLGLLGYTEG